MKLSTAETIAVWKAYQQYPSLYIISDKEHKDKLKEEKALKSILETLKDENIIFEDIKELKGKLKSLRDTYRAERRKVVKSEKSGCSATDIYVPKLGWYNTADTFMQPHVGIREMKDNLNENVSVNIDGEADGMNSCDEETNTDNAQQEGQDPPAKKAKTIQSNCHNSKASGSAVSTQKTPPSGSKSKNSTKKSSTSGLSSLQSQSDEFLLRLEAIRQEARQNVKEKDACDLFGEQVAAELKTLSVLNQARSKYEIQGVLMKFKAEEWNVVFVQEAGNQE